MKSPAFMYVVVADQVGSRDGTDRVPAALDHLAGVEGSMVLAFERTTGDELQGLTGDPATVVSAVVRLSRLGGWRIGIGAGEVELPLPSSTREARGPAYLAARDAIEAAHANPVDLALALAAPPGTVGGRRYREPVPEAVDAETALWLLKFVLATRSPEGWELVELLDQGHTNAAAAKALGISASAASQRLARAHRAEAVRAAGLATRLLARLAESGS